MRGLLIGALLLSGCGAAAATPTPTLPPTPTPQVVYLPAAAPPTPYPMWNATYGLSAAHFTTVQLPDTFDVRLRFTATAAVRVRVMTLAEYAKFATGASFAVVSEYAASTSFDMTFTDSEGCGAYIAVLDAASDSVIYPAVTVTYHPAPAPTGVCR